MSKSRACRSQLVKGLYRGVVDIMINVIVLNLLKQWYNIEKFMLITLL